MTTRLASALIALAALLPGPAPAQNFNLSKFTNAQGLTQNYVYSLLQDDQGFLWIGMAEGLSRYDGIRFTNYSVRDSLADNFVSKLLIDTDGHLWCGHGNGGFSFHDGRRFHRLATPEEMTAPIKDMCLDDRGNIWAVEQNMGLVKIAPDRSLTTYFDEEKFGSRIYTSICALNSMMLLVGTTDGLLLVKVDIDGHVQPPQEVDDIPPSQVNRIRPMRHGSEFLVCQNDGGVYRYSPTNGARKVAECAESCSFDAEQQYDIRALFEDEQGNLYLGTWGNGLREWKYRPETDDFVEALYIDETNGLDNNFVADIVQDREGIFWFATYGSGVVAWINNFFAQYDVTTVGLVRTKVSATAVRKNRLWLGLQEGVVDMDVSCMSNFDYYDTQAGLPRAPVSAIVFDETRQQQYVGTRGAGVYVRSLDERKFHPLDLGTDQENQLNVNGLTLDDERLYVATQGGLLVRTLEDGSTRAYTTEDGLPHNCVNFAQIDYEGQLWLGPKDGGIAMLNEDGGFDVHRLSDVPINVVGMAADEQGRFWLATANNGVLCTANDSVVSITAADGLEKNYCYGIAKDNNGHMWVCHQPGLSCIDLVNGSMRTFGVENGLNQEFLGVTASDDGDLWFTCNTGVVRYIAAYDRRNSVPPIMNLTSVVIDDKRHDLDEPIDLPYPYTGTMPKLEFDFVGICMKDQSKINYEYWLQRVGDDDEPRWMPLGTQNHKEFDYLPSGDYVLNIRGLNSSGIVSRRPLKVAIHIDKPFWATTWFPIAAALLLLLLVRAFANWREQKLRKRQRELEAEVNRQTKEINEKKNEIEAKNKDIMGSITYANRIQTAVLPSRESIRQFPFADSLIMFRPRDIVSGDFYWFNRYDDHALICCADCTGHGVPGAFMTLIGTTILNDATRDPGMRHPAALLTRLDKEVKQTLNKNQAIETRDGMDCAIIDIDLSTGLMVSGAAKRPVYVVRKGKLTTIKGTRRAIGDAWNDNEFTETTTQLQADDCIYMCSDGYTDQLGADPAHDVPGQKNDITEDDAVKFSTKRFTTMLEGMADERMEDQLRLLNETFDKWRHNMGAIDDVIVMGIRYKQPDK